MRIYILQTFLFTTLVCGSFLVNAQPGPRALVDGSDLNWIQFKADSGVIINNVVWGCNDVFCLLYPPPRKYKIYNLKEIEIPYEHETSSSYRDSILHYNFGNCIPPVFFSLYQRYSFLSNDYRNRFLIDNRNRTYKIPIVDCNTVDISKDSMFCTVKIRLSKGKDTMNIIVKNIIFYSPYNSSLILKYLYDAYVENIQYNLGYIPFDKGTYSINLHLPEDTIIAKLKKIRRIDEVNSNLRKEFEDVLPISKIKKTLNPTYKDLRTNIYKNMYQLEAYFTWDITPENWEKLRVKN